MNLTSETALNSATLQLCDNKEDQHLCDGENSDGQLACTKDESLLSTADNTEGGLLEADISASYEGKLNICRSITN